MQIAYMPYKFSFCWSSETTVKMAVKQFNLRMVNHFVKNMTADIGRIFDMIAIICKIKWWSNGLILKNQNA